MIFRPGLDWKFRRLQVLDSKTKSDPEMAFAAELANWG